MGRHLLTEAKTRKLLQDGTAPGRYGDGGGLHMHVAGGSRSWVLRTMVAGARRDLTIGPARDVTLARARQVADAWREEVREGGDPKAATPPAEGVPTFMEAARAAHAALAPSYRNDKHAAQWIAALVRYVEPHFGDKPVDRVTTPDVIRALAPIWLDKPETSRRVRQRVERTLAFAGAQGWRPRGMVNPAAVDEVAPGLPKQRRDVRHFGAVPAVEIPAFLRRLRDEAASAPGVRPALEWTILTGCRTGEALGMVWSEIDVDAALWVVPGPRMKAGAEHRVPLAPRCLEILGAMKAMHPRAGAADPVFPGRGGRGPLSNMAMLQVMRRLGTDATVHGFRSALRTWMADRGVSSEVAESALAHVDKDRMRAAYARTDHLEARRPIMMAWAAHCAGAEP